MSVDAHILSAPFWLLGRVDYKRLIRRTLMRVSAIVLMGLVLSGCVSSSEPASQPVPPANLGSTHAAPPVPPAPSRLAFRQDIPGISLTKMAGSPCRTARPCLRIPMVDSQSLPGPISHPTVQAGSSSPMERDAFRTVRGATSAPEASLCSPLLPSRQMPCR